MITTLINLEYNIDIHTPYVYYYHQYKQTLFYQNK